MIYQFICTLALTEWHFLCALTSMQRIVLAFVIAMTIGIYATYVYLSDDISE